MRFDGLSYKREKLGPFCVSTDKSGWLPTLGKQLACCSVNSRTLEVWRCASTRGSRCQRFARKSHAMLGSDWSQSISKSHSGRCFEFGRRYILIYMGVSQNRCTVILVLRTIRNSRCACGSADLGLRRQSSVVWDGMFRRYVTRLDRIFGDLQRAVQVHELHILGNL